MCRFVCCYLISNACASLAVQRYKQLTSLAADDFVSQTSKQTRFLTYFHYCIHIHMFSFAVIYTGSLSMNNDTIYIPK